MSGFMKFIGALVFIGSVIAGIVYGNEYATGHYASYFNWAFMLGISASGLVSASIFLALGEIIKHLSILSEKASRDITKDDVSSYEEAKASFSKNGLINYWQCEKCGTKNSTSFDSCKGCGEYK